MLTRIRKTPWPMFFYTKTSLYWWWVREQIIVIMSKILVKNMKNKIAWSLSRPPIWNLKTVETILKTIPELHFNNILKTLHFNNTKVVQKKSIWNVGINFLRFISHENHCAPWTTCKNFTLTPLFSYLLSMEGSGSRNHSVTVNDFHIFE